MSGFGEVFASLCFCFLGFHIGLILLELQRIRGKCIWMAWNPVVLQVAIDAVPVIIPPSTHSHLMWDLPFFGKSSPLGFLRCVSWVNILGIVSKSLLSQVKLFAGAIPTLPFGNPPRMHQGKVRHYSSPPGKWSTRARSRMGTKEASGQSP